MEKDNNTKALTEERIRKMQERVDHINDILAFVQIYSHGGMVEESYVREWTEEKEQLLEALAQVNPVRVELDSHKEEVKND